MKIKVALLLLIASTCWGDINSIVTFPAGANGDVQINQNRRFGADTGNLTYSTATHTLATPTVRLSTAIINGVTYYFPSTVGAGGTFWRNDGAGGITFEAPTSVATSTGASIALWDGAVRISSPTSDVLYNGTQFIVSLQGSTSAAIQLDPAVVTLLGPTISLASEVVGVLPSTSIAAGSLGSGVITSSIAVGSVQDSAIVAVSGSKVSGDIPGNAVGITGSVNVSQVVGAVSVYPATATARFNLGWSGSTFTATSINATASSVTVTGSAGLYSPNGTLTSTLTIINEIVLPDGTIITSTAPFGGTLNPATTNFIHNQNSLQSGATAYPDFLYVGSSATIGTGGINTPIVSNYPNGSIVLGRLSQLGAPTDGLTISTRAAPNFEQVWESGSAGLTIKEKTSGGAGGDSIQSFGNTFKFASSNGWRMENSLGIADEGLSIDPNNEARASYINFASDQASDAKGGNLWYIPNNLTFGLDRALNVSGTLVVGTSQTLTSSNFTYPQRTQFQVIGSTSNTYFVSIGTWTGGTDVTISTMGLITAKSFAGAGLSTCGDTTHALGYDQVTGFYSCQSITGSGGSGVSVYPATATASFPFGASFSTIAVNGAGDGEIVLTIGGSTYTVIATSAIPAVGHFYRVSSTWGAVVDGGTGTAGASTPFNLGITTGSPAGFLGPAISTSAQYIIVDSNVFTLALLATATGYLSVNSSSVTMQGNTNVDLLNSTQTISAQKTFTSIDISSFSYGISATTITLQNRSTIGGGAIYFRNAGGVNAQINFQNDTGGALGNIGLVNGTRFRFVNDLNGPTVFQTNDTDRFRIKYAGDLEVLFPLTASASATINSAMLAGAAGQSVTISSNALIAGASFYYDGMQRLGIAGKQTTFVGDVNVSSGLWLNGSPGTNLQVLTSGGPNATPTWTTPASGSGSSSLAVTTGTSAGFNGPPISSPTAVGILDKDQFKVSLLATATAYIQVNTSSITALGPDIDLSGTEAAGTLAAARFGALTGDVTTAGGSYATTFAAVTGTTVTWRSSGTFENIVDRGLTASRPVLSDSGKTLVSGQIDLANSNYVTGILPAGNLPTNIVYTDGAQVIVGTKTVNSSFTITGVEGIRNRFGLITSTFMVSNIFDVSATSVSANGPVWLGAPAGAVTITSNAVIVGATFYQGGLQRIGIPGKQTTFVSDINITSGVWLNGSSGLANQVLTSGGNGAIPTWTTPAGSGDMVLASTQTNTGGKIWQSTSTFLGEVLISSSLNLNGSYGNSGQFLKSGGTGAIPSWGDAAAGSLTIATGVPAGFNGPATAGITTVIFDSSTFKMQPISATTAYVTLSTFTISSFTWAGPFVYTVPTNPIPQVLDIWMCAGGGSGGGGAGAAAGSARGGGSGGGGGACRFFSVAVSTVGASFGINVGTGAVGGAGGVTNNGTDGTVGGNTSIFFVGGSTIAIVYGGGPGRGNQNNEGGGGTGGGWCGAGVVGANTTAIGGCPATAVNLSGIGGQGAGSTISIDGRVSDCGGASGGGGRAAGNGNPGGASSCGGAGGGGAGGCTTLNVCGTAGTGGGNFTLTISSGGGVGGTSGASPTSGSNGDNGSWMQAGKGGGAAGGDTDTSNAAVGGNGGYCGGAGGGGGGGTSTGGNGGKAGTGCVFIFPRAGS